MGLYHARACSLCCAYIVPQFALFGKDGNRLFYGVYAGLLITAAGVLTLIGLLAARPGSGAIR